MTEIPEWAMKAAREAYILVLPPASQWIAEDVRDGFADTSSEIQTAALALMEARDKALDDAAERVQMRAVFLSGKASADHVQGMLEAAAILAMKSTNAKESK